jgi:hypothetical protein
MSVRRATPRRQVGLPESVEPEHHVASGAGLEASTSEVPDADHYRDPPAHLRSAPASRTDAPVMESRARFDKEVLTADLDAVVALADGDLAKYASRKKYVLKDDGANDFVDAQSPLWNRPGEVTTSLTFTEPNDPTRTLAIVANDVDDNRVHALKLQFQPAEGTLVEIVATPKEIVYVWYDREGESVSYAHPTDGPPYWFEESYENFPALTRDPIDDPARVAELISHLRTSKSSNLDERVPEEMRAIIARYLDLLPSEVMVVTDPLYDR